MSRILHVLLFLAIGVGAAHASIFGGVRILVHDPQHRALPQARVSLNNASSGVTLSATSDSQGVATFSAVPIGNYSVQIDAEGFSRQLFDVEIVSDRVAEIHVPMPIATASERVDVVGAEADITASSATPASSITRVEIAHTPGADRTNSLAFLTDFVPGATVVHDQLHVRGGHDVTWAIDGVPVPNTNIASNVGPQFDPKDVEVVEAQRGSYSAEVGDRTYGLFNVAPRSGFERDHLAELSVDYGSFNQTDDHLSFGDHSKAFAYYVSVNANRSDYSLEPPTFVNLHNQSFGAGAFTSLTYNARRGDQFRFVAAARGDRYQVPNDPAAEADDVHDRQREQDSFASLTWLHPFNQRTLLTVTPFFHFNRAAFEGSPAETPSATDNRASSYFGGQASLGLSTSHHNARMGLYAFGQHDNTLFQLRANDASNLAFSQRQLGSAALAAIFAEDQAQLSSWFTLTFGVRATRFAGATTESAVDPRLGAALTIPRVHLVLRASYSRFYQAPPLSTVSGPLLQFALQQGVGFLPLRGERDEQQDFGATLPLRGWRFEFDRFRTNARNYFDHDALGASNIFLPLTIDRVVIRGSEVSVHSPKVRGRATLHLAFSRQSVVGHGAVTGGLTDFSAPATAWYYLDHDQRDTLSTGAEVELPWHAWTSINLSYGSGFLDADGPAHLPPYHSVDMAVGKAFRENLSLRFTVMNVGNERHYIDRSNTFGGSHTNQPRTLAIQLQYRFHY